MSPSAARALQRQLPGAQRLLVCGGGAFNAQLMAGLAAALPGVSGVEVVSEQDGVRVLKAALGQGGRGQEALKAAFLGGLDVRRFELREPSLHDAFISLTGDHPDIDQSVKAGAEAAR